ncbi:MAG TPA: tyrosine-type recombinase/integrase, partial [Solirubrobacteraceae bacterium]
AHVEPRLRTVGEAVPKELKGWQASYRKRRGRPDSDALTFEAATVALRDEIAAYAEQAQRRLEVGKVPSFEAAALGWLEARRVEGGAKRKTLDDWASMLRDVEAVPRKRGRSPSARLMQTFGERRLDDITTKEVADFLRTLDRDGLAPRTVNKYRSLLSGVFQWARRPDTYALLHDPMAGVPKRREADPGELQTYSPEQVHAVASAMRNGRHRGARMQAGGKHAREENVAARRAHDEQDAAAVIVAAFAGLRLGELAALRWRDVDFQAERIRVQRAWVMGEETTTKSRKARSVPMSEQVAQALARLGQRDAFTSPNDLVFVGNEGGHIDGSALTRRYKRARDFVRADDPGVPKLRWHDLRHTFGSLCAAAGVDVVSIQSWMGHSSLRTTQRYMHHAPSSHDASRLSRAFAGATSTSIAAV